MYIVAIGWMYVVTLMAATENNIAAGVATFLFYGALPCSVLVYIMGTKNRKLRREFQELQAKRAEENREAGSQSPTVVTSEQALPSGQPVGPNGQTADGKTNLNP